MRDTRTVWKGILATLLGLTPLYGAAAPCPQANETDAVPLAWIEPLEEPGNFAVGWPLSSPYEIHPQSMPFAGAEFEIVRCLPPGRWVPVASGRVQGGVGSVVRAVASTAVVEEQPLNKLSQSGNLYWRPMIGDWVRPKQATLITIPRITPRATFGWSEIFERVGRDEYGLELSEAGKEALANALNRFRGARGRLAVETFALRYGDREQNAEETQVRASLVAHHLTTTFGLEEGSVLAIGLGAQEVSSDWRSIPRWPSTAPQEGVTLRMLPE